MTARTVARTINARLIRIILVLPAPQVNDASGVAVRRSSATDTPPATTLFHSLNGCAHSWQTLWQMRSARPRRSARAIALRMSAASGHGASRLAEGLRAQRMFRNGYTWGGPERTAL